MIKETLMDIFKILQEPIEVFQIVYLINDERYIKYLSQEIKYLIVDSLECCSNAEVDFINLLSNYTLDTYIYFNKTNDYSVFYNIDMEYIYENIINKIEDNSNSINSIK